MRSLRAAPHPIDTWSSWPAEDVIESTAAELSLPVHVENVMLKRPTLNDVFLQLTGRELRE